MKVNDLKDKSIADLNGLLLDLRKEQFNLKMQKATGQISKPDRIKLVRRDIARIYTMLGQKEGV
ncbi:large subunit ribosomal protein L29 [Methylomagnum ishizawai]|uniref:Large ribosomal subunit protein uL29 n=1 Tax=Methylomagnum ishizawai TaxID=1760988 RepID=A0A1Y6D1G2_9GAMM|nr:50S ribosomal protein L29 [Methylomagnum ishizawai]SMF96768.1 large subunit ribosomal protein L29 [Methylomagnum ishizawai]